MQLYRFLGALAALNYRMSRFRINFVPLNIGLFVVLCIGAHIGFSGIREARTSDPTPRKMTVSDVLSNLSAASYVEVRGLIDAAVVLQRGKKNFDGSGLSRLDEQYVPMLDESRRRGLLLKYPSSWRPGTYETSVTGVLRPMPPKVRDNLTGTRSTLNRTAVNTEYVLAVGESPADLMAAVWLASGCSLALVPWGLVLYRRNVIFKRGPRSAGMPAAAGGPIDLRCSGRLTLNGRHAQTFVEVPAGLRVSPGVEVAVFSQIDASSSFMGVQTAQRAGTWELRVPLNAITRIYSGHLFWGMTSRPAIRLRTGRGWRLGQHVTLSFSTQAERELVLCALERSLTAQPSYAA